MKQQFPDVSVCPIAGHGMVLPLTKPKPNEVRALDSKQRRLVFVGDVGFDDLTMPETVERIVEMAQQTDHPRYVCTGNLDHLALLRTDSDFRRIYREADMVLADGMPVVWLSGLFGQDRLHERVAGSDLFWELAEASSKMGIRLFFLGGAVSAADKSVAILREKYPNVEIVGTYCPAFKTFSTPAEQEKIHQIIHTAQPQILLVGLGAPKQEKWIYDNLEALNVPVSIGVGGTFEMAAGMLKRAPRWMQRTGMEWIFRLSQEPSRLWRRYLFRDIPYFFHLLFHSRRFRRERQDADNSNMPNP